MSGSTLSAPIASGMAGHVLVVDDDRVLRTILTTQLQELDYRVTEAASGTEALGILSGTNHAVDVILLDRSMPGLSGMEFLQALKKIDALKNIPVVMITGSGETTAIGEGIEAGVFYYLVKPVAYNLLASVVASAVTEHRQIMRVTDYHRQFRHVFELMTAANFTVRNLPQAENLALALALAFPEPKRVAFGLAALLQNAVEHGNYGLGRAMKQRVLADGTYAEHVQHLADRPESAGKHVAISFERKALATVVAIRDGGAGFAWRDHLPGDGDPQAYSSIARAMRISFDGLIYNDVGNAVTLIVETNRMTAS